MNGGASIVLSTINATYAHPAFGLRCLRANLGELRPRTRLVEFYRRQDADRVAAELLAEAPRIIGLGVYIWNVASLTEVVRRLKAAAPETAVVLGGPEISHETVDQPIAALADYVVRGEGEAVFADLCRRILRGDPPSDSILNAPTIEPGALADPYAEYGDEDLRSRVIYVETSRGCPFRCEYCLSSLDRAVRFFPLDRVMTSLDALLNRGGRRFKFIDRTFNLKTDRCVALLEFFLERLRPGLSIQFEVVPTRMPDPLKEVIRRFPPRTLRLEVGVQTFDREVLHRIQRRQDEVRTLETFRFLAEETEAVVHADLIVGLPGEGLDGFARGFDALVRRRPAELQVGILKRLRGVPIARHDEPWAMQYRPEPPYDLLSSRSISAGDMERMRRFARYWDLVWNRGRFPRTAALLLDAAPSPFAAFLGFSDWLHQRTQTTHGIPLLALVEGLFEYLTGVIGRDRAETAAALAGDYRQDADRALPRFLKRP